MTRFAPLVAMSLSLLLAAQACGTENDPFLREMASVPRPAGENKANISHVVEKHIPPGTGLQEALRYVEERGFKVYPYTGKDAPSGQKWFVAVKEERYKILFVEHTSVIIESDGQRVLKSRGWLYLKGI